MTLLRFTLLLMLSYLIRQPLQAQPSNSLNKPLQAKSTSARIAALHSWAKKKADVRVADSLFAMLNDPVAEVRREALTTWGRVAEHYLTAVYQAHIPRKDAKQEQYQAAYEAQQRWQKKFLDAVKACASDKEQSVRKEAVRTLARLSPSVEGLFPSDGLEECGVGFEERLSYQAEVCLDTIARRRPVLLFSLANEHDPQIAYRITGSLQSAKYSPVYPVLIRFLKSPELIWRLIGCNRLARLDTSVPEMLPPPSELQDCLSKLVNDKSPLIRQEVSGTLWNACSKQVPTWATQLMIQLLEDNERDVRIAAIQKLRTPDDPQLRQQIESILLKLSKNADAGIIMAVVHAQNQIDADKSRNPEP